MASGYERKLGLSETLSIVVGRIIGSGIFRTPASIMLAVGVVSMFYGAWLVGGIITILSALLFAELVAMVPRSGGPYVYLRLAYHPMVAFLRGWAMFFVSETASIVAVALVFSAYALGLLDQIRPELLAGADPFHALMLRGSIAFLLIWLLTLANCFGVFLSGVIQDIFSVVKIGALLLIAAACFGSSPDFSHFGMEVITPPDANAPEAGSLAALFAALRYSFFAYSGWEGATYVAEEVKQPEKNLPRSLFLGIGMVMVLYLLVNTAYLAQLSPQDMVENRAVAVEAMTRAIGLAGGVLVALAIMISTFGNVSSQVLVKSRTWHAMARDGLFFQFLSPLSSTYRSPNRALVFQGVWASCLLGMAVSGELLKPHPQDNNLYEALIDFFSFTSTVFNVLTLAAVAVLRKKLPELPRPFRVPYLPLVLGLVMLVQGAFLVYTFMDKPIHSLAGVALTLTGLIYWFFFVDPEKRKPVRHDRILAELEKND
ncbi:MAG: amino acid permease [Leptospiraceae bacterium]|nr:amino acid permease [Leptospiraceae bacterium]